LERAYILEKSTLLTPETLPMKEFAGEDSSASYIMDTSQSLAAVRKQATDSIERQYLKQLLAEHNGKINSSARVAGISTRQLRNLLQKYGIKKEVFKSGHKK
jgi:DNA-binding NtrC family response regulator